MKTKTAIYDGHCLMCQRDIPKGCNIAYTGRLWVHYECRYETARANVIGKLCALDTFQIRKVGSACGVQVSANNKYFGRDRIACAVLLTSSDNAIENVISSLGTSLVPPAAEVETKTETVESTEETTSMKTVQSDNGGISISLGGDFIARLEKSARDAATVAAHEAVKNLDVTRLEITVKRDGEMFKVEGRQHANFERLLKMLSSGVNVWIAGPAGSGKTTAVHNVATAMGLPFYFNGAIDSEYKISGFVDAQGRIVSTAFRKAYTYGGVYLFDEVDASLASGLMAFQAALANGHSDFPGSDTPTPRHKDFYCVAAGNTWGLGATSEYVGRNKLDAAFLDRFVQLDWPYDETLEASLARSTDTELDKTFKTWCARIQELRATAKKRGLRIIISPRATINGCKLLAAGLTVDQTLDATIKAKITPSDWSNLNAQ